MQAKPLREQILALRQTNLFMDKRTIHLLKIAMSPLPVCNNLVEKYRQENFLEEKEKAPVDAVTRSGSGLDPDISQANAIFQARRVARIRGLSLPQVVSLVEAYTQA